jgi:hypothetical protein
MPIEETDPWREQYFDNAVCPESVVIPTDDQLAYQLFPNHRWIYNKLLIAETQALENAPHDIMPPRFPVFSKPIYNLRGMGKGGHIVQSPEEFKAAVQPGHMWMAFLTGEHVSTDAALIDGEPVWWRHTVGKALSDGMFDYWTVLAESRPTIESYCGAWLRIHLKGYTGCVNLETIGCKIIEVHLRFADQWPDLYGAGWVEAMIQLYASGRWDFPDRARRTGYSVVLFGEHGVHYKKPDPSAIEPLLKQPGISSVQFTFHEDKPPERHSMPPGGFRTAIVNCWDLQAGCDARTQIARLFESTTLSARAAA